MPDLVVLDNNLNIKPIVIKEFKLIAGMEFIIQILRVGGEPSKTRMFRLLRTSRICVAVTYHQNCESSDLRLPCKRKASSLLVAHKVELLFLTAGYIFQSFLRGYPKNCLHFSYIYKYGLMVIIIRDLSMFAYLVD